MIKIYELPSEVAISLDTITRKCKICNKKQSLITDPQETLVELGQYIRLFVDEDVSSDELLGWITEGVMSYD